MYFFSSSIASAFFQLLKFSFHLHNPFPQQLKRLLKISWEASMNALFSPSKSYGKTPNFNVFQYNGKDAISIQSMVKVDKRYD